MNDHLAYLTDSYFVLTVVALTILFGAILQGAIGFGLGVIAAPVVALLLPEILPATLLALALLLALFVWWREYGATDWKVLIWVTVGRAPGSLAGAWLVSVLSTSLLSLFVALVVLGGLWASRKKIAVKKSWDRYTLAGFISAVFGTATSVGGPPIAFVLLGRDPKIVRGTLSACFVTGAAVSLISLFIFGEFGALHLVSTLLFSLVVLTGFMLSRLVVRFIDAQMLRTIATYASLLAAVTLLGSLFYSYVVV